MYAETTITLQQQNNVLTVPAGAVMKNHDQSYVLTVDTGHKVQKMNVTVGIQGANRVVITNGLSAGQTVIVSGQTNYDLGEVVRPIPSTISMPQTGGSD
jgi:membrane fusion protein, multidrug efflux system